MLRFLAAPAACLALCGAATAQDMPGLATLSSPDLAQSTLTPALTPGLASGPASPEAGRASVASLTLRGGDPGPARIADLKTPPGPAKPWCAQERRVGTGAGFCLVN
jgi:hypothetical protein